MLTKKDREVGSMKSYDLDYINMTKRSTGISMLTWKGKAPEASIIDE